LLTLKIRYLAGNEWVKSQLGGPLQNVLSPRCGVITTLHDFISMLVSAAFSKLELPMPTIYISDNGDDKNDGRSPQTAIFSLKRAKQLHGGRNDCSWHFGPRAWRRIQKELSEKKEKSD
jgi:hypothetical protein